MSVRSIAASASGARMSGLSARRFSTAGGARDRARLHPRACWRDLGSAISRERRRSADACSARRLKEIVRAIGAIPHVAVIRIHTRVPVVDAKRVTPALVAALRSDKAVYVVLHANHPRASLTAAVMSKRRRRLSRAEHHRCSASRCLLKGVNDDAATLEKALFRGLVRHAGEAVLSAPSRSGAWHGASADRSGRGAGADAGAARAGLRSLPAELRPRPAGRARESAGRAVLYARPAGEDGVTGGSRGPGRSPNTPIRG